MRRTQIYLDQKIIKMLAKLAADTGKTRSELIRIAIRETYTKDDVHQAVKKIKNLNSFSEIDLVSATDNSRKARKWS